MYNAGLVGTGPPLSLPASVDTGEGVAGDVLILTDALAEVPIMGAGAEESAFAPAGVEGLGIVPSADPTYDGMTRRLAVRLAAGLDGMARSVLADGSQENTAAFAAPAVPVPIVGRADPGASDPTGTHSPGAPGGGDGPRGPTGVAIGAIETIERGGVMVYTSAGWVLIGVSMWSNREFLARLDARFPKGTPREQVPHIVPTVQVLDFDWSPETMRWMPTAFNRYTAFFSAMTPVTFVAPDAASADKGRRYLEIEYRGLRRAGLNDSVQAEYASGETGLPNIEGERDTFQAPEINSVVSFQGGEYRVNDDVVIRRLAAKVYEIEDHGTVIAHIDLNAVEYTVPQPSLAPNPELCRDPRLQKVKEQVLMRGEAGVWPISTADGLTRDPKEGTISFMMWNNGRCTLVDPPSHTVAYFLENGIPLECIEGIILTHGHADHFGDAVPALLRTLPKVKVYTTRTIFEGLQELYELAIGGTEEGITQWNFVEMRPRQFTEINGMYYRPYYTFHTLLTIGFDVWTAPGDRTSKLAFFYSGDTLAVRSELEPFLTRADAQGRPVMTPPRLEEILRYQKLLADTWSQEPPPYFVIEAGVAPLHTPSRETVAFLEEFAGPIGVDLATVMQRLKLYHIQDVKARAEGVLEFKWPAGPEGFLALSAFFPQHALDDTNRRFIAMSPVLSSLRPSVQQRLARLGELVHVPEGQEILREGDAEGAYVYLLVSGGVEVSRDGRRITTLPYGLVGEAALLGEARNATVRALVDSYVLRFDAARMRRMVERRSLVMHPGNTFLQAMRTLRENRQIAYQAVRRSRWGHLPDSVLDPLFLHGTVESYSKGKKLTVEGRSIAARGKDLYIVLEGRFSVTKRDGSLKDVTVGLGDIVGERAILTNEPRNATVTALGPVRVLRIPPYALRSLLENYPGIAIALHRLSDHRREQPPAFKPVRLGVLALDETGDTLAGSMPWSIPDYFSGLKGRAHTGMLAALVEAVATTALRQIFPHGEGPVFSRKDIEYHRPAMTGQGAVLEVSYERARRRMTIAVRVGEEVVCQAVYVEGAEDPPADAVPTTQELQGGEPFMGVMRDSVSSGRLNTDGLRFKMQFDPGQQLLYGFLDTLAGRERFQDLWLASDDVADYAAMRALHTWGFTGNRRYQGFRPLRDGERVCVMTPLAAIHHDAGVDPVQIPVYLMGEGDDLIGVVTIAFTPHERGLQNLAPQADARQALKTYLATLRATARSRDPDDRRSWKNFQDSLGGNARAIMARLKAWTR